MEDNYPPLMRYNQVQLTLGRSQLLFEKNSLSKGGSTYTQSKATTPKLSNTNQLNSKTP